MGGGYYKSLIPTLTKLAIPSLIILSTIISTCTPILSTTIPSVNAVTANTDQATNQTTINNNSSSTSSTTNADPSDPNYLNSVLEANGIDTSSINTDSSTNDVDPTTMASDLESLNNALEAQAANEGISISLTNPNNQPITTTNPATIDIDPSNATGSGVTASTILAATSITSNVKTAMPGYSLSISTNTDNSNLTNTDSNLSSTQNGSNILPTTGTQDSPTSLTTNTWGYAMKRDDNNQYTTKFDTTYTTGNTNSLTSKWAKVPTNQAPQTIKHTEDTPQAAGDNTTVYYAANVPKNKTAGNYQTTITYTATANVLDPPEVEKVEPSTIRQGLQMTVGETEAVGRPGSSNYQPAQTFTCYVTTAGSVYCAGPAENSGSAYNQILNRANWMRYVTPSYNYKDDNNDDRVGGAFTPVQAQKANNVGIDHYSYTTYWFQVNTKGFNDGSNGKVAQMVVGQANNQTFTCYVTTAGSVYCAGPAENSGSAYNQILNRANWMRYVTPSYNYKDDNNDDRVGGAFTPVQAQKANNVGIDHYSYTTYWFQVNTKGFNDGSNGKVAQMVVGQANNQTFTCYVTTAGSVYCAGPAENSGSAYNQILNRANWMRYVTPSYNYKDDNNDDRVGGAFTPVQAQKANNVGIDHYSYTTYWFQVNTKGFNDGSNGKVAQMVVGQANNQTFTCYVTTAGSVYCAGPAENSGSAYNQILNRANWMRYVTPSYNYKDDNNDDRVGGAFTPVQAQKANNVGIDHYSYTTYWFQVNTSVMSTGTTSGATITLTGKNLGKVTNVYIDANHNNTLEEGTDVAVTNLTIVSDTQLTFTAPSMSPGTYTLIVCNPGNTTPTGTITYR